MCTLASNRLVVSRHKPNSRKEVMAAPDFVCWRYMKVVLLHHYNKEAHDMGWDAHQGVRSQANGGHDCEQLPAFRSARLRLFCSAKQTTSFDRNPFFPYAVLTNIFRLSSVT